MEDGIGVITVIGEYVVGNHRRRMELVGEGSASTQSSSFVDIGAVRVESEFVELSQTGVDVERGCSVICVKSEDWIGQRGGQGVSEGTVR